jgi:transcriptional regulator with PAS, ATPase and Fis domain
MTMSSAGRSGDATTVLEPRPRSGSPARLSMRLVGEGILISHPLPPRGDVVIGRGAESDLRVDDPSISRKHAVVTVDGDQVRIKDLGSANGTRIGERALEPGESVDVAPGEVVDLGSVMLIVQRGYSGQRSPRVPPHGDVEAGVDPSSVVVADPAMVRIQRLIQRVAPGRITVLLLGETGVGKEIAAEMVHRMSPRAAGPFLRLNCGGFSESLLEAELFGHEKGAFTGAVQAKPGLLESAEGGTVFLDEVGELPPSLQVKLLRVLEDRHVMRIGALRPREIDVRFVAATNRDLEEEVARGGFRQDLYFRINGISVVIPPLRERVREIRQLARSFVGQASRQAGCDEPTVSAGALALLEAYAWPGNIRELRNVMERAVLLAGDGVITEEHLPAEKMAAPPAPRATSATAPRSPAPPAAGEAARDGDEGSLQADVEELEKRRIVAALESCAGNQTRAARMLGIARGTLASRLEQFGIPRPRPRKP